MKKFLALALAIVMMAALAVPAFAAVGGVTPNTYGDENNWEDANDDGKEDGDASDKIDETTDIEYGVCQSYVVSIPADVRLLECLDTDADDAKAGKTVGYVYGEEQIGVSDVIIGGDEVLRIRLSTADGYYGTTWMLKDTDANGTRSSSAAVDYYITVEDADAKNTDNYITEAELADLSTVTNLVTDADEEDAGYNFEDLVLYQYRQTGNNGTEGAANNAWIYFSSKGTAQEGIYKATLTFTVSIENGVSGLTGTTVPTP